jgi:hypothetical protein
VQIVRQVAVGLAVITILLVKAPVVGERDQRDLGAARVIRTVQTAQAAYFSVAGYYETLQCLASAPCLEPVGLLPRRPLLDSEIATLKNRFGYRLLFYLGPRLAHPARADQRGHAARAVRRRDGPHLRD